MDDSPVVDADEDDDVVGEAVLLDWLTAVVDGAIVFVISTTSCRSEPVTVETTVVGDAEGLSDDSVADASEDEESDVTDEDVVDDACVEELELVELVDVFVLLVLVDDFVLEVDDDEEDAAFGCTSSFSYTKK